MSKKQNAIIATLLICLNVITQTAKADPVADCNKVIQACDSALDAKQETIDLYGKALKESQQNTLDLQYKIEEIQASKNAWYNNVVLIGALSFIAGSITYSYLKK